MAAKCIKTAGAFPAWMKSFLPHRWSDIFRKNCILYIYSRINTSSSYNKPWRSQFNSKSVIHTESHYLCWFETADRDTVHTSVMEYSLNVMCTVTKKPRLSGGKHAMISQSEGSQVSAVDIQPLRVWRLNSAHNCNVGFWERSSHVVKSETLAGLRLELCCLKCKYKQNKEIEQDRYCYYSNF